MNRFENKIIIITGAAGGIGASTTRRIVSEGGKVVIADYSREKADQFVKPSLVIREQMYVRFIFLLQN